MIGRRAFLAGAAFAIACAPKRRLNVLNWSDYMAAETIPAFEREFSLPVRYATYESAEEMLAKVLTGNSGWDVVITPQNYIEPLAESNLLSRIDHALLPNLRNLADRFLAPPWDPKLEWSVPYLHGSTGIAYHASVEPPPRSWADLWNERMRRKLTMLDDPPDVFGACLKKLGYSINAADRIQLEAATLEAQRQKPLVRAYINAEARTMLAAGDIAVAQMWATTAMLAMDESRDVRFAHPVEGCPLFCDNAVILRESRRVPQAHVFLNYLLRPNVAAANALASKSATPNAAASAFLPDAFRSNPALEPPPDVLARSEWLAALPPAAQRLRDRLWTEIKSA